MIIEKTDQGRTVHIVWFDSANLHGWVYEDFVAQPKVIESVGFVVSVDDDAIAITSGRSDSGGVISPLIIPTSCIVKYKTIELPS